MKLFERLFKKEEKPVVVITKPIKTGMWLTYNGQTGILTADGKLTLVKEDGTNKMVLDENDKPVPLVIDIDMAEARPAHIEEIPVARRGV